LIAGGYASALTSFTGQNFGAGKWGRIRRGFKISSTLMAGWGLIVGFILYFGGGALFRVFIPNDPVVVELGVQNLRILALAQIPACLEGVAAGTFRGQGKTIPPSISSISSNVLRVILAYAFTHFTGLGLTGIWIAFTVSAGIRGLWVYIWCLFNSRKWPKADKAVLRQ